jgi:hypothetical protein
MVRVQLLAQAGVGSGTGAGSGEGTGMAAGDSSGTGGTNTTGNGGFIAGGDGVSSVPGWVFAEANNGGKGVDGGKGNNVDWEKQ